MKIPAVVNHGPRPTVLTPLWTELTSWLAANAPRTLAMLRPPGDPARLSAAEEQLGFRLGAELTEWWHLHDGCAGRDVLPGNTVLGVDDMVDSHRAGIEANLDRVRRRDSAEAGGPAWSFRPEFVPIGDDGAGNYLVVDCRPGPAYGCVKDYDREQNSAFHPPMFESLADLLAQVVSSLHTGLPLKVRVPAVRDAMLTWDWPI